MELIQQKDTGDEIIFTSPETPLYRYVAYLDVVDKDFHDYGNETIGVLGYNYPTRDYQINEEITGDVEISDALNKILDRFFHEPQSVRESALSKALTLGGYDYRFETLRGYSQSEWHDVVIFTKKSDTSKAELASVVNTADAWYKGDVYCVGRERLTTWHDDRGNQKVSWEEDDFVAGYLITRDYSIEQAIIASGIIVSPFDCDEDNRSVIACDCGNGEHKAVKCFDCGNVLERDCEIPGGVR